MSNIPCANWERKERNQMRNEKSVSSKKKKNSRVNTFKVGNKVSNTGWRESKVPINENVWSDKQESKIKSITAGGSSASFSFQTAKNFVKWIQSMSAMKRTKGRWKDYSLHILLTLILLNSYQFLQLYL